MRIETDGEAFVLIDEELTEQIIGAAIEVHREIGPGLLESAYHRFLARELELRGIAFEREVALPVVYKGVEMECGYRMDFVVEGRVVVEIKAIEKIAPIHEAQLITYLKLSGHRVGLLINFNAPTIRNNYIRKVI